MFRHTCLSCAVLAGVFLDTTASGAADRALARAGYVLNYRAAERFCPPVASYFDDVQQATQKVGGRSFRHQLNGGYGLPVAQMADGRQFLHVGADVAWHRAGQGVHAIADGVVRVSQGPATSALGADRPKNGSDQPNPALVRASAAFERPPSGDAELPPAESHAAPEPKEQHVPAKKPKGPSRPKAEPQGRGPMGWGNLIVIEHRLPDGSYVTSIYGHLSTKRLVSVGDVVKLGQQIGTIGKAGQENGGYKPHLHFGLRDGRMHEPGTMLMAVIQDGKTWPVALASVSETEIELNCGIHLTAPLKIPSCDPYFTSRYRDGKLVMPAGALNLLTRPEWITGYALSSDGWHDPTAFLSQMLGQFPGAPLGEPRDAAGNASDSADAIPAAANGKPKRPNLYNPRAKGKSLVNAALSRAKKEHKRVLIMYGGNWCGWCYKLHSLFTDNDPIRDCLRKNYELVMIDTESKANQQLAADFEADLSKHGLPYLTVLDPGGQVVANQGTDELEVEERHDPGKVLAFLEKYASEPASSTEIRMTP